jgi:hypothetical protein
MPLLNLRTPSESEQETQGQSAGGLLKLLLQLQQLGSQTAKFESTSEQSLNLPNDAQRVLGRLPTLGVNQESSAQYLDPHLFDQRSTPNAQSSWARPNNQEYVMGRKPTYDECVEQCLHLLPSPSGDLQSSEYRLCVNKCMGKL